MVVHGNRGKCAQPCRLPYELLKSNNYDNQTVIDKGYLLSTKDLCSLELLPTLVKLGIKCFKIEGRLKNPEYVATVTRIYRKYIDLAQSDEPYIIDEKDRKDLLQVFNRGGFSKGYLDPKPNQEFIYKVKPNNMGIFIGTVYNFNNNKGYISLKLQDDIAIGDTVSLEKEKGSYTISELMINNQNVPSAKAGDIVKIGRIKGNISVNDKIFKMSSKKLNSLAYSYINGEKIKIKINCKITVHRDTPVSMQIYTNDVTTKTISNLQSDTLENTSFYSDNVYENVDFTITSDLIPVDSINSPVTKDRIVEQINKLGGTYFEFENIDVDLDDNLYIPSISKLNQLRRDCISKLEKIALDRIHRNCNVDLSSLGENSFNINNYSTSINGSDMAPCGNTDAFTDISKNKTEKRVSVLLNTLNTNYDYTKLKNIDRIYIPLKFFYDDKFSNTILDIINTFNTYIYMPSILKETVATKVAKTIPTIISKYSIKGFVISNISHIELLKEYIKNYEIIANYNMNIYNDYTINELEKLDITCVTISPELDKTTIKGLHSNIKTETIVYGNTPVMTTNYCLLSKSNSCLESCSNNCSMADSKYYLKDRMNMSFRVIPDSFSKTTTIYNSKKTSISSSDLTVDFVRLDFMDEDIDEINFIVESFRKGEILEGKDFTNGNFNRIV